MPLIIWSLPGHRHPCDCYECREAREIEQWWLPVIRPAWVSRDPDNVTGGQYRRAVDMMWRAFDRYEAGCFLGDAPTPHQRERTDKLWAAYTSAADLAYACGRAQGLEVMRPV